MPSTSPGRSAPNPPPSNFAQILPGSPVQSLQAFSTFVFRFRRYVVYLSGSQLNVLSSPKTLVQAISFTHDLVAVAAETQSGKLVVAGKKHVWVLEPRTEGWTKIWWEKVLLLRREDESDQAHWLSWGEAGEVLVAGDRALNLFSTLPSSRNTSPTIHAGDGETVEERRSLWSQHVSSPLRQADFSPSASLIASYGKYDRLVKIWRRLSFEEDLFDHAYLPHPGTVTHLQWRPVFEGSEERRQSGISGRFEEDPEVLYTIANDGVLRIWRTCGMHGPEIVTLHTSVDLIAAIPQSPSLTIRAQAEPAKAPRYAVVVPSEHFCAAVNAAIGITQDGKVNHSKELLKEMASKQPDVIIAFDGQGRMSAWGVESIGHKRRPETPTNTQAYHIAHAEALQLRLPSRSPAICGTWFQDDQLHLLTHTLVDAGEITWWQGGVEAFFSSVTSQERLNASAVWCGHDHKIVELQPSQHCIVSRSHNEVTQWRLGSSKTMKPSVSFGMASDVLAATTIGSGKVVLTISGTALSLWDQNGQRIAKAHCAATTGGRFHTTSSSQESASGIFISDDVKVIIRWTARLARSSFPTESELRLSTVELSDNHDPTDVSSAVAVAMPFNPRQICLISITTAGRVSCCELPEETSKKPSLEPFSIFETGITQPALFTASEEFAALTSQDGTELVVADLTDGYLEYRQLSDTPITHLACFTPEPRHNFLAFASRTTVDILIQGRYEHDASEVPVWLPLKRISISGIGLGINSFAWTANGSLAIAAGNSIAISGPRVEPDELIQKTKEVVGADFDARNPLHLPDFTQCIKDPLPPWHPSFLLHLLRCSHYGLAAFLLKALARKLKFWSVGDHLDPCLGEQPDDLVRHLHEQSTWLDDDTISDLKEQLEEKKLPRTSDVEQKRLKHVIEAFDFLREHVMGLDQNALRYLFDWRLQLLLNDNDDLPPGEHAQSNGTCSTKQFAPTMHWREICFASHSTTQQPLLDILTLHYDNKLTWTIARNLGIMAWLSERDALERVFEQLGQTAYRSEQPPDPVNASLYYLALHKKPTLLGLWRIATWHKEQRTTMNFLKRDFNQSDAKTAAKKNAYALMGKRRFHYAAAFFLLADDPASSTSLLAGQCEDPQFAIAVARLYCGDGSPVLRGLLEDRIMSQAKKDGDRWLMSWCHSVLLEKPQAAEALVQPLEGIKTWQQDDPATLLLYKELRKAPSEYEYEGVLRTARLLRRMGLWLLALELVSQWEFKYSRITSLAEPGHSANGLVNGVQSEPKSRLDDFAAAPQEPPSMLDSFNEPTRSPPMDEKTAREAKAAELLAKIKAKKQSTSAATVESEKKKREPTQFKEPDPNSLLDSFGF